MSNKRKIIILIFGLITYMAAIWMTQLQSKPRSFSYATMCNKETFTTTNSAKYFIADESPRVLHHLLNFILKTKN
jgi:hypothetical protein